MRTGGNASRGVTLEFEDLFLRALMHPEDNFVFTAQDLKS